MNEFFAIVLSLYAIMIFLIMAKINTIKLCDVNKKLLIITLLLAVATSIIFALIYKLYLGTPFPKNCAFLDFLKIFLYTIGFSIAGWYFIIYISSGWNLQLISIITGIIVITITISAFLLQPMIEENNRYISYNDSLYGYIYLNARSGIFIDYGHHQFNENLTLILCNGGFEGITETIIFDLEFLKGTEIVVEKFYRERGVVIQNETEKNKISVIWDRANVNVPLRGNDCLFLNLSVIWNGDVCDPLFNAPEKFCITIGNYDVPYIAQIAHKSSLRLLRNGEQYYRNREWYIGGVMSEIDYYKNTGLQDW